jgi:hypothetical protein
VVLQRGQFVDRRGFLKDVTEVEIGLGVTGSLLDKEAALAATSPEEEAGQTHQKREAVRSNRSQAATPVAFLDEEWLMATDPQIRVLLPPQLRKLG